MEEDIIVADENFRIASETIRNYGEFLSFHLGVYEWVLKQVANSAIQDERITERMWNILGNLKGIKERDGPEAVFFFHKKSLSEMEKARNKKTVS